ncbi:OmpA family protein [Spirosoma radiotolerans]|uniref:Flagellar motor protein MotB n=1 Tax=Spirosoma radiotolerans TaxID=1379870 RepID=A0A0E3V625_9BACT|nr:OmpA family protein [Spirosoma radiotolerans]AKD54161.1 flagellar motor protein MotB [Spirosoma radiotolerans]
MRQRYLIFLFLAGLSSSCTFGTYPSGYPSGGGQQYPSGGQQAPDDTYPNAGNQRGTGRPADPGVTVNSIRLTQDYTILNLTFTDKSQPRYNQNRQLMSTETIAFDPTGYLIAANGARRFTFVKAEGIPTKREQIDPATGKKILIGRNTFPGDQVTFSLYFERLDKGLENFDLFECQNDHLICWNIYNLRVDNPADEVVYTPAPAPTPVPKVPKKSTTLPPAPSGESGGEMETPKPKPAPAPVPTLVAVSGVVSDAKTKRPVTATIDYQLSASKKAIDSVQSFASTGAYRMSLVKGQVYTYIASARGYQSSSGVLDLSKVAGGQKLTRDITLTPLAVGDKVTLKNIYFEMSKSDLLSASFAELNKLVAMMQDNPNMSIRLEGHTDIIGDHDKNLQLSRDRVIACQRYLVQQGIDIDRIQTIGYGDTRPILTKGTDEERKVNRRVEFVILTI